MFNLAQRVRPKHIDCWLFFKRAEALQWLESFLKPASSPVGTAHRLAVNAD